MGTPSHRLDARHAQSHTVRDECLGFLNVARRLSLADALTSASLTGSFSLTLYEHRFHKSISTKTGYEAYS